MKKIILPAIAVLLMSGCATQSFSINGTTDNEPTYEDMQHFFVSGLVQEQDVNAAEICGGAEKVVKVESHHSFINGVLGVLTYGIYTPRDARVYCKSDKESS